MNNDIKELSLKLDRYKLEIDKVKKSLLFLQGYLDGLVNCYDNLVVKIDSLVNKDNKPIIYIN